MNPDFFKEMDKTNMSEDSASQNDSEDPDHPEEDGDEVPLNLDEQPKRVNINRLREFNRTMSESQKSKKLSSKQTASKLTSKVASILKSEAS